jgi:hypothetical protein
VTGKGNDRHNNRQDVSKGALWIVRQLHLLVADDSSEGEDGARLACSREEERMMIGTTGRM